MPTATDLLKQAELARELARRARDMASLVLQKADEENLRRYADQEEAKAAALEQQAQTSSPKHH
jgi:hypothetical protein